VAMTHGYRLLNIFFIERRNNPNRDLTVVRSVSGIQSPAAAVEPYFTPNYRAELGFELIRIPPEGGFPWRYFFEDKCRRCS
jgi:hypothetical protein